MTKKVRKTTPGQRKKSRKETRQRKQNLAATKIQPIARMYNAKKLLNKAKESATRISSAYRIYKAKKAATRISSAYRMYKAKKATTKISSAYRMYKAKKLLNKAKAAATKTFLQKAKQNAFTLVRKLIRWTIIPFKFIYNLVYKKRDNSYTNVNNPAEIKAKVEKIEVRIALNNIVRKIEKTSESEALNTPTKTI